MDIQIKQTLSNNFEVRKRNTVFFANNSRESSMVFFRQSTFYHNKVDIIANQQEIPKSTDVNNEITPSHI